MDGIASLALQHGTYEITPSPEMVEGSESPAAALSMLGRSEIPLYDVVDPAGECVFEVVQQVPDEAPDGISVNTGSPDVLFQRPDGDPVLSLEIDGPVATYTLRDRTAAEPLATARRSLYVLGKWQLMDAAGDHRATASRKRSLRNLLSSERYGTYRLRTADGTDVARCEHLKADLDGGSSDSLRRCEVEIDSSPLPTEIVLAFAYIVFRQSQRSSSGATGGAAGE